MRIQTKMILIICTLLFLVILILGGIFQYMENATIKDQIGTRALRVAQTVASMPEIRSAFNEKEPSRIIQPITEEIRVKTDAEFIVVGNRDGIRYSHPIPERIGQEMVGGDNGPVLEGNSIISEAVGSLGPSLRGKTPIFDNEGNVIGIVSVGFMMEDINQITADHQFQIILIAFCTLLLGMLGAILIAKTVKKAILGLEPQEIAALYEEKRAILESIREGIIAINARGIVTMVNEAAIQLLELGGRQHEVAGKHILDVLPSSRLFEVIRSGKAEFDRQMWFEENELIVNRIPIYSRQGQVIGAVSSFRNKSEIFKLGLELSQVKRYAEALRAQTHEFSNKLYMISGLIQLESYQEAIDVISRESDIQLNLVHFIMKEIPDPIIGGLLIGKFNRAQELKVQLQIDSESSFRDVPAEMDRDLLVTIIGNIIDNAMDAVLESDQPHKTVNVFFTDLGDDLIIEVEDNGIGIPDENQDKVFEMGFSTKQDESRGFGLFLVQRAAIKLNGYVTVARSAEGGTIFTVALPKHEKSYM